jgi:hypothetical protein
LYTHKKNRLKIIVGLNTKHITHVDGTDQ